MSAYVSTKNRMSVNVIAKISILGALAFLIMMFEIPLPFAPEFYKLGFDEVIVLLGGFALGPWAAICIEALKIALHLLLFGTVTMGVGEIANALIGLSFVLPAILLYQSQKTKKRACIAMIIGTISMTIVGSLINYGIMLPAYAYFMHMPLERIVALAHTVNPSINSLAGLILFATIPFNLLKGTLCSTIAFLSYKKISPLIKKQ